MHPLFPFFFRFLILFVCSKAIQQLERESKSWLEKSSVTDYHIEGHIAHFLGKVQLMMELVMNPKVETVCEVGLNGGHSALLSLLAKPLSVLSFDLFEHSGSFVAAQLLQQWFLSDRAYFHKTEGETKTSQSRFLTVAGNSLV